MGGEGEGEGKCQMCLLGTEMGGNTNPEVAKAGN